LFGEIAFAGQVTASVYNESPSNQQRIISVHFEKEPLADALHELARKVKVGISYETETVPSKLVTYEAENKAIFEILDAILEGTGLFATLSENRKVILIKEKQVLPVVQQETITGTVTDASTGVTMAGVNILVKGTSTGAATDTNGEYELTVESLQDTLIVSFIGYGKQEVPIAGRTTLDILLEPAAVGLDQIVVTGTGGQATRREVGNSISSISMDDLPEIQTNVDNVLGGRIAGATVSPGSGMSGSGAQIRLRGSSSISMSNYPLIYIDGVRIARGGYPKNVPPVGYSGRSNNTTPSPLNDIDPNDIERIETIKGAAATTLYGTQAAAGVIQIFTKNGFAGDKPRWTLQINQGFKQEQKFGNDEYPYMRIKPWLKKGYNQKYYLSVGGGDSNLRYFVSGTHDNAEGVLPDDNIGKTVVRGNFSVSPYGNLDINWNTSYTSKGISNPPAGNNAQGLTINAFRGLGNYFGDDSKEVIDQVLDFKINNNIKHLVTGGSINYEPFSFWSNKLSIGYDRAMIEARQYRPFGFVQRPQGAMSVQNWSTETLTLDYTTNLNFQISTNINSKTAIGGQIVESKIHSVTGYAENFSSPGEPTLNSGGSSLSFEQRVREINYGVFGQEILGFKERYFLTLGLRVDGNSAFGENLGLKAYPKVSTSYVISEEPFWNSAWGQLKLRAAYGHAGQAPGVFDAVRTWSPEAFNGEPTFTPNTVGNVDLGPERTIETEVGVEGNFLNQRLSVDFTYYNQVTKNALLPVPQIPSKGFLDTQIDNAGRLKNEGIEASIDFIILQGNNFNWDVGLMLATNKSEVLDLGNSAPFSVSGGGWIEEGHAIPAVRGRKVLNADEYAEPIFYNNGEYYIYGPNYPKLNLGLNMRFELPYGVVLSANAQYSGGHYIQDGPSDGGSQRAVQNWPITAPWFEKIEQGQRDQLTALQRSRADVDLLQGAYSLWVYPADNIKLQNITLQIYQ
jgi:TonB-dependent SusC/RagA subfamily outer membrane receptor